MNSNKSQQSASSSENDGISENDFPPNNVALSEELNRRNIIFQTEVATAGGINEYLQEYPEMRPFIQKYGEICEFTMFYIVVRRYFTISWALGQEGCVSSFRILQAFTGEYQPTPIENISTAKLAPTMNYFRTRNQAPTLDEFETQIQTMGEDVTPTDTYRNDEKFKHLISALAWISPEVIQSLGPYLLQNPTEFPCYPVENLDHLQNFKTDLRTGLHDFSIQYSLHAAITPTAKQMNFIQKGGTGYDRPDRDFHRTVQHFRDLGITSPTTEMFKKEQYREDRNSGFARQSNAWNFLWDHGSPSSQLIQQDGHTPSPKKSLYGDDPQSSPIQPEGRVQYYNATDELLADYGLQFFNMNRPNPPPTFNPSPINIDPDASSYASSHVPLNISWSEGEESRNMNGRPDQSFSPTHTPSSERSYPTSPKGPPPPSSERSYRTSPRVPQPPSSENSPLYTYTFPRRTLQWSPEKGNDAEEINALKRKIESVESQNMASSPPPGKKPREHMTDSSYASSWSNNPVNDPTFLNVSDAASRGTSTNPKAVENMASDFFNLSIDDKHETTTNEDEGSSPLRRAVLPQTSPDNNYSRVRLSMDSDGSPVINPTPRQRRPLLFTSSEPPDDEEIIFSDEEIIDSDYKEVL